MHCSIHTVVSHNIVVTSCKHICRSWEIEFECFVDASWEWRKEISVRGVGDMDKKNKAVRILIDSLLRKSKLWDLFGELWEDPRYFDYNIVSFHSVHIQ